MDQRRRNYVKYAVIILIIIALIALCSAIYIEEILSARISYKNIDHIMTERQKLIDLCGARPVTFKTQDDMAIAALLLNRPEACRVFIICHGFKHSKEQMSLFAHMFPHDILLLLDLRGQGQSSGDRISLGLNEHYDVAAAVEYIKNTITDKLPIFGIGISQGGATLLRAAAYGVPLDAVVADSAPSEFKNTIAHVLQRSKYIPFPVGWCALTCYECVMGVSLAGSNYENYASNITCPVLLMHDKDDHLIGYCHAENFYRALGSTCKKLWTVKGTRHGKMFEQVPAEYRNKIEDFIQEYCYEGSKVVT